MIKRFAATAALLLIAYPLISSAQYASGCASLTRPMVVGSRDATTAGQVSVLQAQLLQMYPQGVPPLPGNADPLEVTGYYGKITMRYVLQFQQDHGIPPLGIVGPLTRAALASACGNPGGGGGGTGPVGLNGFSANPLQGIAPIQVTFTETGLAAGQYKIDYGDGTAAPLTVQSVVCFRVPCNPASQWITHTYLSTGTYTAVLYTQPINSCGTTACLTVPIPQAIGVVTINVTGQTTQASLSANPSSGSAPLNVLFTASGPHGTDVGTAVTFGDGTTGTLQSVAVCPTCSQFATINHTYLSPGTFTATLIDQVQLSSGQPLQLGTVSVSVGGIASQSISIASLTPTSGYTGTIVTIHGSGFSSTDNIVHFGIGGTLHVPSSDGQTIFYTIPANVSACDLVSSNVTCAASTLQVNNGVYQISVTNASGFTSTSLPYTVTGTQGSTGPLSAAPTNGQPPLTVNFSSANAGTVTFGDGASAAMAWSGSAYTVAHTYYGNTAYTATEISPCTSASSCTNTILGTVTINVGSSASAFSAVPSYGLAPLTVQFTSTGPSGTNLGTTVAFGDGQTGSLTFAPVCNTCNPIGIASHTYGGAGSFTATLEQLDASNAVIATLGTASISVTGSSSQDPALTVTPLSGTTPLAITFNASAGSNDPNTYLLDFGDGSAASAGVLSTTHTYTSTGSFTATLKRTASAGGATVLSQVITVSATTSSSSTFNANVTSGAAPLVVNFTASSGSDDPNTYYIDFGDGGSVGAGSLSVSHTYSTAGTYTASLKRTASAGGATVATETITVSSACSGASGGSGSGDVTATPTHGCAPLTVSITVPKRTSSFSINLGDGTTQSFSSGCRTTGGCVFTHTYQSQGTYRISNSAIFFGSSPVTITVN